MTQVRFEFGGMGEVSGSFAYAREPAEGGRLRVEFSSNTLRRADGAWKTLLLEFNNIGQTEPLPFLESLDQGYLNDKLSNLSARRCDLVNSPRTSVRGEFTR